jgi:hypothetical protein
VSGLLKIATRICHQPVGIRHFGDLVCGVTASTALNASAAFKKLGPNGGEDFGQNRKHSA